jgi:tRNA nucleotidyltransferase (CCA-adding enzyme)
VTPASLDADLARRDFTINAMAVSVKRDDFGTIEDPHGGYDDLRAGLVRVLHERSFDDDPTRLLRAVRYASRFGFEIEQDTRHWLAAAVRQGQLGRLHSGRVRDELVDLLEEPALADELAMMAETGLGQALHPHLDLSADAVAMAVAAGNAIERLHLGDRARPALARLAALCRSMRTEELESWLDRLKFTAAERQVVVAATDGPVIAEQLSGDGMARSAVATLLRGTPSELLALASTTSPKAEALIRVYLEEVEPIRLEISGDDLIAAGFAEGPALGTALERTRALKLDGAVSGREQELAVAIEMLSSHGDSQ